jgi:acid phosphatase
MKYRSFLLATVVASASHLIVGAALAASKAPSIDQIETLVVIYAENRSFDNLYGAFPGANGLQHVSKARYLQRDRDGSVLKELPPIWDGLTAKGVTPAITQAQTEHLPNRPYAIDDPKGFNAPFSVTHHDLWHRFYQEQMQIDGGKNDKFVAWADSGAMVMGHYDIGPKLPLWQIAKQYTLADNFYQGAFGGSFLNHFMLICACAPVYPHADTSPAKPSIAAVDKDGINLTVAANSPKSAIDGIPKFVSDGNITPDFYAVNTMAPPYQPSYVKPTKDGDPKLADPNNASTLPPQTMQNIGDLLSAKGVGWAWYAGAWQVALDGKSNYAVNAVPNFQYHHQPFNYFVDMAPGMPARAEHLRDGGMNGVEFIKAVDAGALPNVTFYKPQGNLNEHGGYTDVLSGDTHIADVITHLQKSRQWAHMLIVVTYDENGGLWDHAAPPKADRWGPGNRVPTLIVSPFARNGHVDHTQYDTTSILKFITRRWSLPVLPGLAERDKALKAHGKPPMGDLTAALKVKG